ncbi:hypothetical protein BH10BAC3_BH10BAC3_05250 [soil metagenome]
MNHLFPRIFFLLLSTVLVLQSPTANAQPDTTTKPAKVISATDSARLQKADSTKRQHQVVLIKDSITVPIIVKPDTSLQTFYRFNPYVDINAPMVFRSVKTFSPREKDLVFYVLVGLLLMLGFIRIVFAKYFTDLFRIFFQTTFRQKSIREQLLQNKMPSLLLNLFFCTSGGLFLYFVASYKGWLQPNGFLQKASLCIALVTIVYTVKYIGLQISGWLFGMREVTETYLFIVFLINKVVGVLLLPAILILALGSSALQPVLLVVSLLLLMILYLYRYLIALPLVRNHAGLTGFHFFIYLCAFEVVPLLLIYKLLLLILSRQI